MRRDEAAALLGVPQDADSDVVRHAWRIWARLAHPDAGGNPGHFARLDQARRLMLAPTAEAAKATEARESWPAGPDPARAAWIAPPRSTLRSVMHRPARPLLLAVIAAGALGLAALPAALEPTVPVEFAVAAMPAAAMAAIWALAVARSVLGPAADPGHRMTVLAMAWLPLCLAQLVVSAAAGSGLVTVLPLLALPLVAAVAAVNPGAGLWRPIGSGRSVPVR